MQRRMKLVAATAAAAALTLGAGLAHAQMNGGESCGMRHGPGMMGRQLVERYDANKDGTVTQQEIEQNRAQWLAEFDADKNGTLSLDEFKLLWLKARNEMMVREFQFFDRDGNGQVTIEEYKGPLSDLVSERDRNDDGSLGADDHASGEGRGWRHGRGMGQGMGEGRAMMGHGRGEGGGPCMDGEGPDQQDDAPAEPPGEGQTTP